MRYICALFLVNALSAKAYAEAEFWFASVKVATIVIFIVLGGAVMFGLLDFNGKPAPMLHNFTENGGLFPNGALAVLLTMITVNYSFQGTELIGIASGESENPEKQFQKQLKHNLANSLLLRLSDISCCRFTPMARG